MTAIGIRTPLVDGVEKAITAKRAPIRVRVTPSAHVLVTQRRLMPDRVWDGFLGTQFKRPGGWPGTRYEAKAKREGRPAYYLRYQRCT